MSDFLQTDDHDEQAQAELLRRGPKGFAVWKRGRAVAGVSREDAREAGRAAGQRGEDEDACPQYAVRSLATCWIEGLRGAQAARRVEAQRAAPACETVGLEEVWPAGKPLPAAYRPCVMPCESCRRVRCGSGEKSVLLLSRKGSIASFCCRGCGHRWRLPIEPQC